MNTLNSTDTKQLRLFKIENPLKARLGADFFKLLPQNPGIYWMLDGRGRLLYVGKSKNLKKRLSSYRSLRPENLPARLARVLLGTEHIGFETTDSEPKATQVELALLKILKPPCNRAGVSADRVYDWVLRERPRSWRLEIQALDLKSGANSNQDGFRASPRFFKTHGSLLRQLHGLSHGHFSILEIPTGLLKGPSAVSGSYDDREMNDQLAGPALEEKRLFNQGLRETVQMFIDGIEPWPEFPCPIDERKPTDRWSLNLWEKDQADLKQAFQAWIRPRRLKMYGLSKHDLALETNGTD